MAGKMLDDNAMNALFREARTYTAWQDRGVEDSLLEKIYDLMKFGPTSANCNPVRFVFIKSKEAKERLKPYIAAGNVEKTMTAPVTAIIGHDLAFYEHLPVLFPHVDAKSWFVGNDALVNATAFRNGSLQGAYFMLAARAMGLDCGAMSGFDADGVQKEFFAGTSVVPNFLCNLGYGDGSKLHPRGPR
ncbi:MAG: malonic semialdehyde reductase, partial [Alphaproteobacteria bacterium]